LKHRQPHRHYLGQELGWLKRKFWFSSLKYTAYISILRHKSIVYYELHANHCKIAVLMLKELCKSLFTEKKQGMEESNKNRCYEAVYITPSTPSI
jgi:hypothetical protein